MSGATVTHHGYHVRSQPQRFGKAVRAARLSQNLSQLALANWAGVSDTTVTRIESGAGVTLANAVAVAQVLNLSADALMYP